MTKMPRAEYLALKTGFVLFLFCFVFCLFVLFVCFVLFCFVLICFVLFCFSIPGNPLQARYHGPYIVESKVGEVDNIVKTPDRRKNRQLCHVNMLQEYEDRNESDMANQCAL